MNVAILPPANLHAGPPVLRGAAVTTVRSVLCWTQGRSYVAYDCTE